MRILGLLLMLTLAPGAHADAERYLQLSMHMVKVLAAGADGRINTGTGVQLDAHTLVTNCHVVGSAHHVIAARGSSGVPATARTADRRHDLCVMNTPVAAGRPAALASSTGLKVGDAVYAVGFSGGKSLSMSEGRVMALHEMDGARVIETDASFQQGASGGALFDGEGRMVGVLTFFIPGLKRHFAVPADWLSEALVASGELPLPLDTGSAPFWAAADEDKPYFLRAIQHENDGNWGRLQAVAKEWVEAEPNNRAAIEAAVRASHLPAPH